MARIVMVDDDELMCAIVARTLAPCGHTVVAVRDGDDAVDMLWSSGPDLVILDCALPGKTGLAILREIRDSAMFGALPVLILTGRRSEWHARVAIEAGADDYMRKPFAPEELTEKIDRLLAGAAAARPGETLLDTARIADLRASVGVEQADTLLAMMEQDIALRSRTIAAMLAVGDDAARKEAHSLRGAADGVGALDLARRCHAIEQGDTSGSKALVTCATATISAIAQVRTPPVQAMMSRA